MECTRITSLLTRERVCALGGSHVKITGITGVQERLRAQGSGKPLDHFLEALAWALSP